MTFATADAPAIPTLNERNFAELRDFISPTPDEVRWQEVRWRTTFWEAVQEGQATDRPILAWAMNGHPLTCT